MNAARSCASTTGRILRQLRHDRRTIALLLVVPVVLLTLLYYMYDDAAAGLRPDRPDHAGRLPVRDHVPDHQHRHAPGAHHRHPGAAADHPDGQGRPAVRVRHRVRRGGGGPGDRRGRAWPTGCSASTTAGSVGLVSLIAVANAVLGVALGLSAARSPAPSSRRCSSCRWWWSRSSCSAGCSCPATQMAGWLQAISDVLPMSYAVQALQEVGATRRTDRADLARPRRSSSAASWSALILAAATLRRRTD